MHSPLNHAVIERREGGREEGRKGGREGYCHIHKHTVTHVNDGDMFRFPYIVQHAQNLCWLCVQVPTCVGWRLWPHTTPPHRNLSSTLQHSQPQNGGPGHVSLNI